MPVQFFGQYLLSKQIVTREQLLDAVCYQESHNLKLGEYAVKAGYLTEAQANRVNNIQQTKDLRFGDAAVELKLLTEVQVGEILTLQRNNHVYLGDAVIHEGFADEETIKAALSAFQDEQKKYQSEGYDLSGLGMVEPEACDACMDLTNKLLLRMWDVQSKLGEPLIAGSQIGLEGDTVEIAFTGDPELRYIIAAPREVIARGARKILREDNPDDETRADLISEFANVVAGSVVGILAKLGKKCDIGPPIKVGDSVEVGEARGLIVPIVTPDGDGKLVLIVE